MITLRSLTAGPAEELSVLLVDDEPIARQILREALESVPGTRIVGEAENGQQALEQIAAREPDLVFLDLQMPVMGGFEVVRRLESSGQIPVVVFVTAFDEYAVQAFEAGAIDYLLKPVRQARLVQTLERARNLRGSNRRMAESLASVHEVAAPPARKIVGRQGEEYVLLNPDEVLAFQADGDLVWIVTAKQRFLATQPLKLLQEKLATSGFERVHRNALVNVNHVRKLAALSSQRWLLTLANGQEFIVSKRQARSVRRILDW